MLLAKNKKAYFHHEILKKYLAGIVLRGYEVKAIREKKVGFEGSYIEIVKNEPLLINFYIGRYSKQSQLASEQDEKKPRKLLLGQNEINEINREITEKGKTAIPLAILLKNNFIKVEIGVVKGRKKHEKKQVAKEKQIKKDLQKQSKELKSEML